MWFATPIVVLIYPETTECVRRTTYPARFTRARARSPRASALFRRKMLIACAAAPAVAFAIPPFGWNEPHPSSDPIEDPRKRA